MDARIKSGQKGVKGQISPKPSPFDRLRMRTVANPITNPSSSLRAAKPRGNPEWDAHNPATFLSLPLVGRDQGWGLAQRAKQRLCDLSVNTVLVAPPHPTRLCRATLPIKGRENHFKPQNLSTPPKPRLSSPHLFTSPAPARRTSGVEGDRVPWGSPQGRPKLCRDQPAPVGRCTGETRRGWAPAL